jgi:hypothetical protein
MRTKQVKKRSTVETFSCRVPPYSVFSPENRYPYFFQYMPEDSTGLGIPDYLFSLPGWLLSLLKLGSNLGCIYKRALMISTTVLVRNR